MRFEKTYEIAVNPPPPMPWLEYEQRVIAEWRELLDADPDELMVQRYLEAHPALVPGAFSAFGRLSSGHGPFPSAVITQPPLQGLQSRTPDFVWISRDSSFLNPVFIELKAPYKRYLTDGGNQHHQLTYALDQIRGWRRWFNSPTHAQLFLDYYEVPPIFREREWRPLFVLVYGRRGENPEAVGKLRAHLTTEERDLYVVPYEHIEPERPSRDFLCVRNTTHRYEAVTVPATVRLDAELARDWVLVHGKGEAAGANPWLTPERKAFLAERFEYWDAWVQEQEVGIISTSDRE